MVREIRNSNQFTMMDDKLTLKSSHDKNNCLQIFRMCWTIKKFYDVTLATEDDGRIQALVLGFLQPQLQETVPDQS